MFNLDDDPMTFDPYVVREIVLDCDSDRAPATDSGNSRTIPLRGGPTEIVYQNVF